MKRFLPALLSALLLTSIIYSQSLIPFRDGTRWGYCNPEGKIILPCIYNNAFPFTNVGAVVVVNNKYGLIETKGKWMIPASFDSLGSFDHGIAVFKKEGKFGLTDKTGKITVPAEYKKVEQLKSGFYLLSNGEYINGLADKNGTLILPVTYKEVNDFRYSRAVVQKTSPGLYQVINEKGQKVFELKKDESAYEKGGSFYKDGVLMFHSYTPVRGGGYYDTVGNILTFIPGAYGYEEEKRKLVGWHSTKLFPFTQSGEIKDTLSDGKMITVRYPNGYCDRTGQFVIKPKFNEAGEFKNGTALVLQDGKAWLINEKGEPAMSVKYQKGFYISDTRIVFRDNTSNYYLYESSGKLLATLDHLKQPTAYTMTEGISEFKDGFAIVTFKDETRGYIDTMGNFITGMRFKSGTPFSNGLAMVTLDDELSYINKKGQLFYRRNVIPVGRQQWDYQDLNTRVFANGDSIYKAVSITDFLQKGQEKKPAFYHVSYIPNTQSKTRLLYNWYAVMDPRGLAPAGWVIPTQEEFELLKKAGCSDSISADVLYALGFDNGGQLLLKGGGLGTRFQAAWWTRTPQPNTNEEARIITINLYKNSQPGILGFAVYPTITGFPVRCIRKPEPVKPGIKLPALPKLNCDSLLAISRAKFQPVTPVEKKTEPVITDYASHMAGTYKEFTCVLTGTKDVTFTKANVVSFRFTIV